MAVLQLSGKEFEQQVLKCKQLVVVDFWAPWCGPCMAITPILEELAKSYNKKVRIYKINIDENRDLTAKYQVLTIPTLLFFKNGKISAQLVGARGSSDIKKVIDSLC